MIRRLANVLYTLGWLIGAVILATGLYAVSTETPANGGMLIAVIIAAAIPVGIGWAIRYVLVGNGGYLAEE